MKTEEGKIWGVGGDGEGWGGQQQIVLFVRVIREIEE